MKPHTDLRSFECFVTPPNILINLTEASAKPK
jgi:hypothetical protein